MFLKFFRKKDQERESADSYGGGSVSGIDPAMYYCSSCNEEYRLDLPACLSCGSPLVSGAEKLRELAKQEDSPQRSMVLGPADELVTLRQGPLAEVKHLLKVLQKGGIPGLIGGDAASCGKGCRGPEMYLQIRAEDVEPALKILATDFVRSTALNCHDFSHAAAVFDPTAAETLCPACGCRFSPSVGACPDCGLCLE